MGARDGRRLSPPDEPKLRYRTQCVNPKGGKPRKERALSLYCYYLLMGTQQVTTTALAAHLGSPPAYGETAAAVLETCSLVAVAEEQWDPKQVMRFQEEVGIHEKVWGRLLAIHNCNRWQGIDQSDLPGNYTALYALTTLSDEAWTQLVERKVLRRTLSSRQILIWESQVKTGLAELPKRVEMMLACSKDKADEVKAVVEQFKAIAAEHGMLLVFKAPSERGFVDGSTPEQILEVISKRLIPLLKELVEDAGKVLKDSLGIHSEEDLINASMRDFLKFINRTAGSASAALESYGKQYCLKLALEYNRMSNTRANRFNYKKKLEELAEHRENQGLRDAARLIYRDFIGEVPGEK
jgi:hypothetical protein